MTRVDVIVAVWNEEQCIPAFLDTLMALPLPEGVDLRVTFVEDSSTDGTRPLLRRLADENPRVGFYSLVKGFGQGPALIFGLSRSTADAMIIMDVDGSHPLEVIPEMIRHFLGGAQAVLCVRKSFANRKAHRRLFARAYQLGVRLLTGADGAEQNIYYRLISANVARRLLQQPQYWTHLRFPLPCRPEGTLRKVYVDMEERVLGESKYGVGRLAGIAVDGVLSLMSGRRFAALLATLGLIALVLAHSSLWPLAVLAALGIGLLIRRFIRMRRPDTLRQMQVLECGNVPAT
jgi:glycosyltransferase involved in cell wall biosynthesis